MVSFLMLLQFNLYILVNIFPQWVYICKVMLSSLLFSCCYAACSSSGVRKLIKWVLGIWRLSVFRHVFVHCSSHEAINRCILIYVTNVVRIRL